LKFVDEVRIHVKAGDGGDGAIAWRREKFIPRGGPAGGDGGDGGDVVLVVDPQLATLLDYRYVREHRARSGEKGGGSDMNGRNGAALELRVPPGTVVKDAGTGDVLGDLAEAGDRLVVAKGGKGGLGNMNFATSTNQAPRHAEPGTAGEERDLVLELKLLADVGIVGFPNAGKSTLISRISRARPKIADYPFTTLEPNLGVVEIGPRGGETFVMADIPGLIEGAAEGVGLGYEFLRHVERTRLLVHVIDGSGGMEGRDPLEDFELVDAELLAYSDELASKPRFAAINKIDLGEARDNLPRLHGALKGRVERVFDISGVTGEGVPALLTAILERLRDIPRLVELVPTTSDHRAYTLESHDESHWEVERISPRHFQVTGTRLERALRMTDFTNEEAAERFQRILEGSGVSNELEKLGVQPGDTVHILDAELIWDQAALAAEAELERRSRRKTHRQRLRESFGEVKTKRKS
jgi:GTP-binding protein